MSTAPHYLVQRCNDLNRALPLLTRARHRTIPHSHMPDDAAGRDYAALLTAYVEVEHARNETRTRIAEACAPWFEFNLPRHSCDRSKCGTAERCHACPYRADA